MARPGSANSRRPPRPSDFLTGASRIRNKRITTIDGHRIAVCSTRTLADPRSGIGPPGVGDDARRTTPSMHCSGYRQPLTDAAFGTPFHTRDGPWPADTDGNLSQAGLLHAPLFRLTGVERGSEPVADRQRLFWLLTSAAPTIPNTSIDAAPVMVLATAPRRPVQRRFARARSWPSPASANRRWQRSPDRRKGYVMRARPRLFFRRANSPAPSVETRSLSGEPRPRRRC